MRSCPPPRPPRDDVRPIPVDITRVDVSMHTNTPSRIRMRPEVVEGGVGRTQLAVEVKEFATGVSKE